MLTVVCRLECVCVLVSVREIQDLLICLPDTLCFAVTSLSGNVTTLFTVCVEPLSFSQRVIEMQLSELDGDGEVGCSVSDSQRGGGEKSHYIFVVLSGDSVLLGIDCVVAKQTNGWSVCGS